jgi:hypothetical protein
MISSNFIIALRFAPVDLSSFAHVDYGTEQIRHFLESGTFRRGDRRVRGFCR